MNLSASKIGPRHTLNEGYNIKGCYMDVSLPCDMLRLDPEIDRIGRSSRSKSAQVESIDDSVSQYNVKRYESIDQVD